MRASSLLLLGTIFNCQDGKGGLPEHGIREYNQDVSSRAGLGPRSTTAPDAVTAFLPLITTTSVLTVVAQEAVTNGPPESPTGFSVSREPSKQPLTSTETSTRPSVPTQAYTTKPAIDPNEPQKLTLEQQMKPKPPFVSINIPASPRPSIPTTRASDAATVRPTELPTVEATTVSPSDSTLMINEDITRIPSKANIVNSKVTVAASQAETEKNAKVDDKPEQFVGKPQNYPKPLDDGSVFGDRESKPIPIRPATTAVPQAVISRSEEPLNASQKVDTNRPRQMAFKTFVPAVQPEVSTLVTSGSTTSKTIDVIPNHAPDEVSGFHESPEIRLSVEEEAKPLTATLYPVLESTTSVGPHKWSDIGSESIISIAEAEPPGVILSSDPFSGVNDDKGVHLGGGGQSISNQRVESAWDMYGFPGHEDTQMKEMCCARWVCSTRDNFEMDFSQWSSHLVQWKGTGPETILGHPLTKQLSMALNGSPNWLFDHGIAAYERLLDSETMKAAIKIVAGGPHAFWFFLIGILVLILIIRDPRRSIPTKVMDQLTKSDSRSQRDIKDIKKMVESLCFKLDAECDRREAERRELANSSNIVRNQNIDQNIQMEQVDWQTMTMNIIHDVLNNFEDNLTAMVMTEIRRIELNVSSINKRLQAMKLGVDAIYIQQIDAGLRVCGMEGFLGIFMSHVARLLAVISENPDSIALLCRANSAIQRSCGLLVDSVRDPKVDAFLRRMENQICFTAQHFEGIRVAQNQGDIIPSIYFDSISRYYVDEHFASDNLSKQTSLGYNARRDSVGASDYQQFDDVAPHLNDAEESVYLISPSNEAGCSESSPPNLQPSHPPQSRPSMNFDPREPPKQPSSKARSRDSRDNFIENKLNTPQPPPREEGAWQDNPNPRAYSGQSVQDGNLAATGNRPSTPFRFGGITTAEGAIEPQRQDIQQKNYLGEQGIAPNFSRETKVPQSHNLRPPNQGGPPSMSHPNQGGPPPMPHPNQSGPRVVPHPNQGGPPAMPHPNQGGPRAVPHPNQAGPRSMPHPNQGGPPLMPHPNQGGPPLMPHPNQGGPPLMHHPNQGGPPAKSHPNQGGPAVKSHPNQGGPPPMPHPNQGGPPPMPHPNQGDLPLPIQGGPHHMPSPSQGPSASPLFQGGPPPMPLTTSQGNSGPPMSSLSHVGPMMGLRRPQTKASRGTLSEKQRQLHDPPMLGDDNFDDADIDFSRGV